MSYQAPPTDRDYNPSVRYLRGVGPALETALRDAGIVTLADLLCCIPEFYVDPSHLVPTQHLGDLEEAAATKKTLRTIGRVLYAGESFTTSQGQSRRWFELHLGESFHVNLRARFTHYALPEMESCVRMGGWMVLVGQMELDSASGHCTMIDPQMLPLGDEHPWPLDKMRCLRYPSVRGINPQPLRRLIQKSVAHYSQRLDHFTADASRALHALHLDWSCADVEALNAGTTAAHATITALKAAVQGSHTAAAAATNDVSRS